MIFIDTTFPFILSLEIIVMTTSTSTTLTVFTFPVSSKKQSPVKVFLKDGEPWFVARNVSDILGYRDTNSMTRNLDPDETATHNSCISSSNGTEQMRNLTIINESGLYSAILKSRKPEAKKFKRWVTSEVLPSIRKTGSYSVQSPEESPLTPAQMFMKVAEQYLIFEQRLFGMEQQQDKIISAVKGIKKDIKGIKDDVATVLPLPGYLTVAGFCTENQLKLTTKERQQLGKKANAYCKKKGIQVDSVVDKRYGFVNAYPEKALVKAASALAILIP